MQSNGYYCVEIHQIFMDFRRGLNEDMAASCSRKILEILTDNVQLQQQRNAASNALSLCRALNHQKDAAKNDMRHQARCARKLNSRFVVGRMCIRHQRGRIRAS